MTGLVDPSTLQSAVRNALEIICDYELRRKPKRFANANGKSVSLKMADRLEAMKLARRVVDNRRGADILMPTGVGQQVVDIIKIRRERKSK